MADERKLDEGAEEQQASTDPVERGPSGLFSIIKAGALVLVLVVVEVVAASMLVPSAKETERLGRQFVAATKGGTAVDGSGDASEATTEAEQDVREVELGLYNVTRFNPTSNTTMAIDFELYGTVLAADVPEFQRLFDNSQARVREQVIMTLHAAESSDLTDAGLGLIKRQILEKTNRALGQPLVREMLFSKFNFVER
jgi:flagellar FliL protein